MCPSSWQNLVNIVVKVSRYHEAARYLYRIAKRHQIVRHMKTVIAHLPDEAFLRNPAVDCDPALNITIKRITGGHQKPEISHLCHLLKISEEQLHEQFAKQTRKTLEKAKIHAEVKLIYYCDANTSSSLPRVICSSKDACFLCNVLISTHCKMYTPRHHGRLYPGWRLPTNSRYLNLEKRFAAVLEKEVRNSLGTLLMRRSKTKYPDPNESTLLALSLSTSTIRTVAMSELLSQTSPPMLPCSMEAMACTPDEQEIEPQTPPIPLEDMWRNYSPTQIDTVRTPPDSELKPQPTSSVLSQINSEQIGDDHCDPGRVTASEHENIVLGDSAAIMHKYDFYTHGPLEIPLERTSKDAPASFEPTPTGHGYDVESLSEEEVKAFLIVSSAIVVDVDSLHSGEEHCIELPERNVVFLRAQGVVVKIRRGVDNGQVRDIILF